MEDEKKAQNGAARPLNGRTVHTIRESSESRRLIHNEIKEDVGEGGGDEMSKLGITYCIMVSLN